MNNYSCLEHYVGKVFYIDFNSVKVEMVLGGESGPPYFLCRWEWSNCVFCAEPYEVMCHFDDSLNPIKDFEY